MVGRREFRHVSLADVQQTHNGGFDGNMKIPNSSVRGS